MSPQASDSPNASVTVCLGEEYDDALRARLAHALGELGAVPLTKERWSVAGSQELMEIDVHIDGNTIRIASETYIGLSITGPAAIVEKVQALVVESPATGTIKDKP